MQGREGVPQSMRREPSVSPKDAANQGSKDTSSEVVRVELPSLVAKTRVSSPKTSGRRAASSARLESSTTLSRPLLVSARYFPFEKLRRMPRASVEVYVYPAPPLREAPECPTTAASATTTKRGGPTDAPEAAGCQAQPLVRGPGDVEPKRRGGLAGAPEADRAKAR